MKFNLFIISLFCCIYSSFASDKINWNFPLPRTHTGIPIANGKQGLLIWGTDNQLNITISRANFWDRRGGKGLNTNYEKVKDLILKKDLLAIKYEFGIKWTAENQKK